MNDLIIYNTSDGKSSIGLLKDSELDTNSAVQNYFTTAADKRITK